MATIPRKHIYKITVHTDRKVLPREWRRVWAVDFGFTNPFVWQMWAIDPDGRLWLEKMQDASKGDDS